MSYLLADACHSDDCDLSDEAETDAVTPSFDTGLRRCSPMRTVAHQNNHPIRYACSQLFCELSDHPTFVDADKIRAVQFNDTSDMIAAGDKGGRVVLLKRISSVSQLPRREQTRYPLFRSRCSPVGEAAVGFKLQQTNLNDNEDDCSDTDDSEFAAERPLFEVWTQFPSHERELDFLTNRSFEESINQICWCSPVSGAQRLLVSNEKTITLCRVYEKDVKRVISIDRSNGRARDRRLMRHSVSPTRTTPIPISRQMQKCPGNNSKLLQSAETRLFPLDSSSLKFSRMEVQKHIISAAPKRIYRTGHPYHINSISLNIDEETFLSADDLRIDLWNLYRNGDGINILDIKPDSLDNLNEALTGAEFHPRHCSILAYTNTQAIVKLCDLRTSPMCRSWVRKFEEAKPSSNQSSCFEEIIASITDLKFSPDGQFILTRDYMNLRLWDVRMERAPIRIIPVHDHLRKRLCDLYQNDCIFDKFQCCFSGNGGSLLTGSYNGLFQTYSFHVGSYSALEASTETVTGLLGRQPYSTEGLSASFFSHSTVPELAGPMKRIICLDASQQDEIAAVAVGAAIYFYNGTRTRRC